MTQHFRGGQELPPLGTRRFFDFNFQPGVAVPPGTADLLPGDSLVTSCSYDTTDRTTRTKWVTSYSPRLAPCCTLAFSPPPAYPAK